MTEKNNEVYIDDIVECIDKITEYTKNISEDKFLKTTQVQDSVIRRIEIIGEAAGKIPEKIKNKYKEIPWKDIIGMRNVLIHHYGGVDLSRIWKVVINRMSELKEKMLFIKKEEFSPDK